MSFILLGARGTGKTWLLEREFREDCIMWINLLNNREFLKYQGRPDLLRGEIEGALSATTSRPSQAHWVIIDEVQRVPEMLNEVHAILEDSQFRGRIKFGLSGSSARKLKRGGGNLLAGRALLNHLYPLTTWELRDSFDLTEALNWGLLPAVVNQRDPLVKSELLETYVAVYLREEIREEQIVRNLDPFTRFLEVAAQTSGRIVNYMGVGRDCGVDSRAVARYFQILEDTLLGVFIPPYDRSVRKQQGKSPKFYLFDLGVLRALERNLTTPVAPGSYGYGRLFEHFVVWEIVKLNEYSRKRYKLSFLITKDGAEIDLIIERPQQPTVLMEIKSGARPDITDAKHLLSFRESFNPSELWVVSQIERERTESHVRFLHWQTALRELYEG